MSNILCCGQAELVEIMLQREAVHVGYGVTIMRYTHGIYVTNIVEGSPAHMCGLRVYDRIRKVYSANGLVRCMARAHTHKSIANHL